MGGYTGFAVRDSYGNIVGYSSAPGGGINDITEIAVSNLGHSFFDPNSPTLKLNPNYQNLMQQYQDQQAKISGAGYKYYNPNAGYSSDATGVYQQTKQAGGRQNPYVEQKFFNQFKEEGIQRPSLLGLTGQQLGRSEYVVPTPTITKDNKPQPVPAYAQPVPESLIPLNNPQGQTSSMRTAGGLGIALDFFKNPDPVLSSAKTDINNTMSFLPNLTKPNLGSGALQNNALSNLNNFNINPVRPAQNTGLNASLDTNIFKRDWNPFSNPTRIDINSGLSDLSGNTTKWWSETNKDRVNQRYKIPYSLGSFGSKQETKTHHKPTKKPVTKPKRKTKTKTKAHKPVKTVSKPQKKEQPVFWGI
jgi:hypothetical protein